MRVLHLISTEGYYGAENMLLNLVRALRALRAEPAVAVFLNEHNPHFELADRLRLHGIPVDVIRCGGRIDHRAVEHIRHCAQRREAALLHTHGYKADLYGLAAMKGRLHIVATCHNWTAPTLAVRAYEIVDRLSLGAFDKVVAVSQRVARMLRRSGVSARKIVHIANGIDVLPFRAARNTSVRTPVMRLGYVGRLVPAKGIAHLLNAAQKVIATGAALELLLAGEGHARSEFELLAQRLGIRERVIFLGEQMDMPAFYAGVDAMVLPSLNEGLPMCVLEAMAAGVPVVATRVGDVPQLVRDGETGILVDPGSEPQLANALERLSRSVELRQRLGMNGYQAVCAGYSAEAMAREYMTVYNQITYSAAAPAYA
jgi:glycosyltransferase involved in cell wall biosynthesis